MYSSIRGGVPPCQICRESLKRGCEIIVLDVPDASPGCVFGKHANRCYQLAETHVGTELAHFFEAMEQCAETVVVIDCLLLCACAALGRFNWPITSTCIFVPGVSLAIRVARVTPSIISRIPSEPSYTQTGGIPSAESPCAAIWR